MHGKVIVHADQAVDSMATFRNLSKVQIQATNLWVSLCAGAVGVRGGGALKRLDRSPPVLFRAASRVVCDRESGEGAGGDLGVLVCRKGGLDACSLLGSRAETVLDDVS